MIKKIFKNVIAFIQIKFLELSKQIKLDNETLYIYKKSIPKVVIENFLINEKIKEIGLYEPSYSVLEKIDNFKNLEELCIRFFQSEKLPENIWNLKNLKKLKLEQCEISNIKGIKKLTNLEYLNLSCKIKILPAEVSEMKKLKYLNLKRSYLLKKVSKFPESLEILILNNENLHLTDDSLSLPNLKKLEIINTQIKKFPDSIANCKDLYSLTIYSNIKNFELTPQIGTLSKLDYLELNGVGVKDINFEFTEFKNLKEVVISNTNIVKIPDSICECFKLKYLTLSESPIQELPVDIGNLRGLLKLNIEYTNIQKLRRSISNLKKLEYLYLPEGVKIPSDIVEMEEKGKLTINYSSYFDDSSQIQENFYNESFANEFGKINRAKDIWLFE